MCTVQGSWKQCSTPEPWVQHAVFKCPGSNKGLRKDSAAEARESDPYSVVVASSPAARWLLVPRREHSNFLTSASASCQLCGLAPLRVPRLIVAVSVGSSFPDALMGNVSTSRRGACTRSDHMTWEVMPLPWAVLSRHIG